MNVPSWLRNGILAAIVVVLLGAIYVQHRIETSSALVQTAVSQEAKALLASPKIATSTTTTATSTGPAAPPKATAPAETTVTALPPSGPSAATISAQQLAGAGANLLKSMVNIVCLSSNPSIPSISGSGIIIDSRGIVLTAAHVAQLFLLQDYLGSNTITCLVRDGSPARRAYTAEPIYVSPSWIKANPDTLETTSPTGTGQNDFALLAITGTATSTPVPTSFPAIPLAQGDPQLNEQVAIGSYGAQYLTSSELNYALYPILVFGTISDRYTFDTNTVDLIAVDGSAASQEGSSGGGMVDANGDLVGTITTSSVNGSIADRQLNAITPGHMRRSFQADMGKDLDSYLADNSLTSLVSMFQNQANILAQMIKY